MSIFKTPYDTTVGRSLVLTTTLGTIKEYMITKDHTRGTTIPYESRQVSPELIGITEDAAYVPSFVHPLLVESKITGNCLAIDLRPFTTVQKPPLPFKVIVRNKADYNLALIRQATTKLWLTQGPSVFNCLSTFPCSVFASWISERVSFRFALTALEQFQLAVIAAYYYQTLFLENEPTQEERNLISDITRRSLNGPSEIVWETIKKIPHITNISDFSIAVKEIIENPRLENFNAGILISILKGSWFGTHAMDLIAVALEHPPTWVCLVYTAMAERTFKNSVISKSAEKYGRRGADKVFIQNFVRLVEPLIEKTNT
jgi:hypothetical protein